MTYRAKTQPRPPSAPKATTQDLRVVTGLNEVDYNRLIDVSKRERLSVSAIARRAIVKHLGTYEAE